MSGATGEVTIRDFVPADRERLYAFLGHIWPGRSHAQLDARWWWWAVPRPPLLLACDEQGAVLGMCGYLAFDLYHQGAERRGAWVIDYFVLREHQGRGIGKRFVAELNDRFAFLASLNQTDAAWATFKRIGWRERYFAPLFLAPSARLSAWLSGRGRGPYRVEVGPAQFGDEFNTLWQGVRDRISPASARDAGVLARRFAVPNREYTVIRGYADGRLAGYLVVRLMPPGGIKSFPRYPITLVADHLVDPAHPELFRALLGEAARWTTGRGASFILCMSTDRRQQGMLRQAAFLSGATPVLGRRLKKLDVGMTSTPQAPGEEPWHLTPLDCDLDLLFGATP